MALGLGVRLTNRSTITRYTAALACAGAGVLVRLALTPVFGSQFPFVTVYPVVLTCARFWGVGPAIVAMVVGAAGSSAATTEHDWVRTILLFAVGSISIWIVEVLRRSHIQAEDSAAIAEERLQQLHREIAQRAQEEEISAQLRAVVESSADAILSKDVHGIIRSWNHGAELVFGYTAEEACGRHGSLLVPADRQDEEDSMRERILNGGLVNHFETIRCRKDGKLIPVSLTISPVRDAERHVVGFSHIARDISERKALEEQLRETQKLESLGVMAGGLAHDFNNLLTGIMGNASLAMGDLDKTDPALTRMSEILQASERAALLVRQMLAYAGKGRLIIERLDLSEQVAEILPLIRTSISRKAELDLQLGPHLPDIEGDRSQMQQLIMNLTINAAEAIGDKPGRLTIRTAGSENGKQVVLEVKDTGCGMDKETSARIFDPFYTTKFAGRGLGLSAVMGIIRTHHGSINVETTPGQGSTFTVTLPATDAVRKPAASSESPDLRGQGEILVVDDEELVRSMAQATLETFGYRAGVASNGKTAVDQLAARPRDFAAILLDLTMPVMDGEEALEHIRRIRPDIPVILSSGFSEKEAVERFAGRKLAGFLQKPYTATALARAVMQAMGPSAHHERRATGK